MTCRYRPGQGYHGRPNLPSFRKQVVAEGASYAADEDVQRELARRVDINSESDVRDSGTRDSSNVCENSGFVCFGARMSRMPLPPKEARRGKFRFASAMQIYNASREHSKPVRRSSRAGSHTLQALKGHKKRAARRFGFLLENQIAFAAKRTPPGSVARTPGREQSLQDVILVDYRQIECWPQQAGHS